jgi:ubiquinone/menaquinone biosynthesis C-methylase UbiE
MKDLDQDKFHSQSRFSDRVQNYVKYRPHYPEQIIPFLLSQNELIFTPFSIVADIGSGTGILTELFLKAGTQVYGIEPNDDMRTAGELYLSKYKQFHSIKGTAEATTLPEKSIDLIVVGQAFHWFNKILCKKEFNRILKADGNVVLIWNTRKLKGVPFFEAYEDFLIKYGTDYIKIKEKANEFDDFFPNNKFKAMHFPNFQDFDLEGLTGRLLSSSYIPLKGKPNYENMINELYQIFNKFQQNNRVRFEYDCEVYYGKIH